MPLLGSVLITIDPIVRAANADRGRLTTYPVLVPTISVKSGAESVPSQGRSASDGELASLSVGSATLSTMTSQRLPDSGRLAGLTTTAELVEAGFAKKTIRTLVRRGVLISVRRGAYAQAELVGRLSGPAPSRERLLSIAAAVAVAGPDAVASHEDAAMIHGIDLLGRQPANLIAVSRPLGPDGVLTGLPGVRIRHTALPAGQLAMARGIPVTSAARTVIDLARTTPFRAGVVAADSALYRRKTSRTELAAVITTSRRWPGIERARQAVDFSDARSESPFESISRVAFRDGGLPPPELLVWVGGTKGRSAASTSCGVRTGPSRRPTERSSTRTRTALAGSYAAMPNCARPGSRSFTSPGPT
jgi:hypothetical protein